MGVRLEKAKLETIVKLNLVEKKSVTYSIMDAGYNSFSTAYRDKRINNF